MARGVEWVMMVLISQNILRIEDGGWELELDIWDQS
jgi:hypothetical protein